MNVSCVWCHRQWAEEHQIDPALRALLPKDEGKPVERPAEAALRTRMAELLQRIHTHQVCSWTASVQEQHHARQMLSLTSPDPHGPSFCAQPVVSANSCQAPCRGNVHNTFYLSFCRSQKLSTACVSRVSDTSVHSAPCTRT